MKGLDFLIDFSDPEGIRTPGPQIRNLLLYPTELPDQKKTPSVAKGVVGVAGFEPTTSCSQSRRDTGLRYTPKLVFRYYFFNLHFEPSVVSNHKSALDSSSSSPPNSTRCGEGGIRTLGTVSRTAV